jgi:nucleoside-diphosphate-sugar epimerase
MRVLITGGSGFIAAWLIARLQRRDIEVTVFDLKPDPALLVALAQTQSGINADRVRWVAGDVSDRAALMGAASDADLIVHMAALLTPACQQDPIRAAHVNLIGTLNVFECALERGHSKVLYMSSAGVFGPDDGTIPAPTTHYGALKLAGEGCARAYFEDHAISSVGLRPLVVYGPGRSVGLTAGPTLACRAAALGESYDIPFSGDTEWVFVDDVAATFEAAMDADIDGALVFNVTGVPAPVAQFASLVEARAPGVRISISGPPIPVAPQIADNGLRDRFPNVKLTGLGDGIEQTLKHYSVSH